MKLVIDNAIPFLEGRLDKAFECVILPPDRITADTVKDADALLVRTRTRCAAPLLENSRIKFVATATIGLDHFDIPWLEKTGIEWHNAPGCNAPAVAQYTWRALLQLGFRPKEMTLGVVGYGNVGSIIAEWGRRLGAKVLICDPPRADRGLTDETYISLKDLMSQVDAVTFHTPLIRKKGESPDTYYPTYHLADYEALNCLHNGAILVNAARGGVVDENALARVKEEKHLKVALDTWENEPAINRDSLAMADIATFHIAGYSRQGKERATYHALKNLENHFGISLNKEGLAPLYTPSETLTEENIISSYDIMADDEEFRRHPEDFEYLRDNYNLREEVS